MTDTDADPSSGPARMTRRSLLTLVGASAIAGCSGFGGTDRSGAVTIRSNDLPDIRRHEEIAAPVQPAVPVSLAPSYLEAARTRVHKLVTELPMPLGPEEIPNGHIRQQLTDAASDASDGLDDARTARTGWVTLRSLRHAREHARYAAAGWAVAERGLTERPLRNEYARTVSTARATRRDHEYLGTDPVRAALVHSTIETALERAANTELGPRADSQLLAVAQWGETAESAQASLSDARHMATQFRSSLPDAPDSIEDILITAAETLLAALRDRRSNLPPEPTNQERHPSQLVAEELRWKAESEIGSVEDAYGPASAVVHANTRLTRFLALERIDALQEAGELSRPSTAAAVRSIRQQAYDALRAALNTDAHSGLVREAIVDAGYQVIGADRELSYLRGEVDTSRLDDSIASYWHAIALANSAPAAARQTASALRTE